MKILIALCFIGVAFALPHKTHKNQHRLEDGNYYQGDIRLPLPMTGKNGLVDTYYRWPNAQVAYTFGAGFPSGNIPAVQRAMADYAAITSGCINWVPRTNEADYVEFASDESSGCWSYVGKIGGVQNINYPQWCIDDYPSTMHEMLHALGFYHEQSSTNRDDYVTIMWNNIDPAMSYNFDKYDANMITPFGESYDYLSVMHYYQYAFSNNGQPTIITLDPAYQNLIGYSPGLSQIDINKLLKMYNCPTAPPK